MNNELEGLWKRENYMKDNNLEMTEAEKEIKSRKNEIIMRNIS